MEASINEPGFVIATKVRQSDARNPTSEPPKTTVQLLGWKKLIAINHP